jgi:AcrR family transcriptional regulator
VPQTRPYDSLRAKGEDRKQRILAVAQRLLTRNGWRNTTLESKEQLLHAVLDVRDADDDSHADRAGDLISEVAAVAERFYRSPELVGTYAVLLAENVHPDAPLHDRLRARYHDAIDIISELIRRGQRAGQFRMDMDVTVKAVQILAFITGMETTWLLNPSIPLTEVFKEYAESLARDMAPPNPA